MTRTRASAKQAGSRFERRVADYLATFIDDRIDRRVKTGAKDRGDLAGIRITPALGGGRVVAELKNYSRPALDPSTDYTPSLGPWALEAETERGNDDAVAGVVVHKRHGVADVGGQWVTMTVRDFVALMTGQRPDDIP